MKHLLSFIIIINLFVSSEIIAKDHVKKPKPKPAVVVESDDEDDDDEDEKVVLANFANMAHSMTQFHDPATVGPALFSFFGSVFNIAMQMCKNMPIRGEITPEQIEIWFNSLSPETQQEIIQKIKELGVLNHGLS